MSKFFEDTLVSDDGSQISIKVSNGCIIKLTKVSGMLDYDIVDAEGEVLSVGSINLYSIGKNYEKKPE